jgi:peroxiredoxin
MAELRMLATHTWPRFRAQGLRIIGVVRGSEAPEIAKVASSMHVDFPLLPDPKKEIFLHFAARGHPRAYLVGRDGTIKLTSLGYTDDEVDRIEAAIERELRP